MVKIMYVSVKPFSTGTWSSGWSLYLVIGRPEFDFTLESDKKT